MAMNPFEERGIPLERQIRTWSQVAAALAMRVTDLIAQDHRRVRELFLELERMDASDGERRALLDRIVDELDVHARAEEDVFCPAVRAASRRIDDAEASHEYLRSAIAAFRALDAPISPSACA